MPLSQPIALVLLLAGSGAPALASTVHKWVDADGVTHYSDKQPPVTVTAVERIDLPAASARAADHGDDYYSIANQWRRMYRERIELERARQSDAAPRGGDTIVIHLPEPRRSVAISPRHRPRHGMPIPAAATARRHPLAIPGRDWPVGLHPGRLKLRGSFRTY